MQDTSKKRETLAIIIITILFAIIMAAFIFWAYLNRPQPPASPQPETKKAAVSGVYAGGGIMNTIFQWQVVSFTT